MIEPLRVLVVDDEPLARERIVERLARTGADVSEASRGKEALKYLEAEDFDIVFLDVRMPDMTGIEVVRKAGDRMPVTVFVTAYSEHAVAAFDLAAADYLVKPFDDERFDRAFDRAQQASAVRRNRIADAERDTRKPEWVDRLAVPGRGRMRIVATDAIDYVTASGPYVELHTSSGRHLLRMPLQDLEERLDPREFIRIHRGALVRLDRIESLLYGGGGDYAVLLRGGVKLSVSRTRKEDLETRLGKP